MRYYVFFFFFLLFVISVAGLAATPQRFWNSMEWWQTILYILPAATNFCIVLISYWSWQDKEHIELLKEQIAKLRREKELEK